MSTIVSNKEWRERWNSLWQREGLHEVRVAVAYCSQKGAQEIKKMWDGQQPKLQLLVGLNDGVTDICAQNALMEWSEKNPQVEIKGAFQSRGRFHPKIYIFIYDDSVRVLLGSVNLTHSAFHDNTEAALELSLSPLDSLAKRIEDILDGWWQSAQSLPTPDALELELARLGVQERLLATMRPIVRVEIEALLAPARGRFDDDVFALGREVRIEDGAFLIERLRKAQVLLLGEKTYNKLCSLRDKAHQNCHYWSFPHAGGYFVPETAFVSWRRRHRELAAEFAQILQQFQSPEHRQSECKALEGKLREDIDRVWRSVHENSDRHNSSMPEANLHQAIEQFLQQFNQRSPHFARDVRLNWRLSPHPLPAMLQFSRSTSLLENELHRHAVAQREEQLREWAETLISTTRKMIVLGFKQLLDKSKQPQTHDRIRNELREQLKQLNFYGDAFCREVIEKLPSLERTEADFRRLYGRADADWQAAQNWTDSTMTFTEVLADFTTRVGWKP